MHNFYTILVVSEDYHEVIERSEDEIAFFCSVRIASHDTCYDFSSLRVQPFSQVYLADFRRLGVVSVQLRDIDFVVFRGGYA